MIEVSKLNDQKFYINSDLIELLEETPDTTISMTTGKKIVVKESLSLVVEKVIEYKRNIYRQF